MTDSKKKAIKDKIHFENKIDILIAFILILVFLIGYFIGRWAQKEQIWLDGKFIHGGDIYKVEKIKR